MSWEQVEENKVIKITEASDYVSNDLVLPKEVLGFFKAQGENQRLPLIYHKKEYPGYIETEFGVTKLKWSKVLVRKLREAFPKYEDWFKETHKTQETPRLEFEKSGEYVYLRLIIGNEKEGLDESPVIKKNEDPGLSHLLNEWIKGYPNYYPRDFRFSFKDIIKEEIPKALENLLGNRGSHYKVQGFPGETQWAEIPWVGVMNKGITDSIEKDLSLIYLLAMDTHKLYVALVYSNQEMGARSLSEMAEKIREMVDVSGFETDHREVFLANASLVSGTVCYKVYTETPPDEEAVMKDFEGLLEIYESYAKIQIKEETEEEITLPIVEVTTLETVPEPQEIKKSLEIESEESLDKKIEEREEVVEKAEVILKEEPLEKEVEVFTEVLKEEENEEEVFQEVINPEVKSAGIIQPSKEIEIKKEKSLDLKDLKKQENKNDKVNPELQNILAIMGSKGYFYTPELVKNYYLSLKTKPFVMIKGRIGTGKTTFPRVFAEAVGANTDNGRFQQITALKNWRDPSFLFGYLDNRGHFVPGILMKTIRSCYENPEKPHFLLIDEINNSFVEDYFKEVLEGINGGAHSMLQREDFGGDVSAFREYGNLEFPDNLYLIGTINETETDIPCKVYDSGNTIEMPIVEVGFFPNYGNPTQIKPWENSQFKIQKQTKDLPVMIENLMFGLKEIQKILVKHRQPMGYRVINEILAFGINSCTEDLYQVKEVIDLSIIQRIIPILNLKKEKGLVKDLMVYCVGKDLGEEYKEALIKEYPELLKAYLVAYPRSGKALMETLERN